MLSRPINKKRRLLKAGHQVEEEGENKDDDNALKNKVPYEIFRTSNRTPLKPRVCLKIGTSIRDSIFELSGNDVQSFRFLENPGAN